MLGHASAAMTLDTYADLFEDDLDNVSERLDAARSQPVVAFSWGLEGLENEKTPQSLGCTGLSFGGTGGI